MSDINTILNACELVWRQQSVGNTSIADMRNELESHLVDAQGAGKAPETVVGSDIDRFARSWASAQPARVVPTGISDSRSALEAQADGAKMRLYMSIGAIALVALVGLIAGPKSSYDGIEAVQWVFVIATFGLLIGEMISGGFFVLPFGIAGAVATILSFAKVEPPILILVFILVSALGLWGLREFASKDDDDIVPVGASRYVNQTAVVTEAIHGVGTIGRVRFETESWMAITDGNQYIPEGTVIRVSEVRGARLVVSSA